MSLIDGSSLAWQECLNPACRATHDVGEIIVRCPKCQSLFDVKYDWNRLNPPKSLRDIELKWRERHNPIAFSGVWRFHDLLPFAPVERIVTIGEGQTLLQRADQVGKYVGSDTGKLFLQYEGMNPSGSFKDNGMTAAFTHANMVGATKLHVPARATQVRRSRFIVRSIRRCRP